MKLSYSQEELVRWRAKNQRRIFKKVDRTGEQTLAFINSVGFCLAAKSDGLELINLWDAAVGDREYQKTNSAKRVRSYYLSYAWEIQSILPNHNSVFYGKVFRRRPSLVSCEYLPYFYALTERSGAKDEYLKEYLDGKLSAGAKLIMDVLVKQSPLTTKDLRNIVNGGGQKSVERGIDELERKMFIGRVVGNGSQFGAEWAPVVKSFPSEVRKAKRISHERARFKLLEKYFENQLMSSVEAIRGVFSWSRQDIYHAIGQLVHAGVITPTVSLDGKRGKFYCYIH